MNVRECFEKGLLIRAKVSHETVKNTMSLAKHNLARARGNLRIGYFDVAFTLAYQSMLHSARALIFNDGIKERSHVCVLLYLKEKHRQDPRILKYLNILDSYRIGRHEVVYRGSYVPKGEAVKAIDDAKNFLKLVGELLHKGEAKEL